MTGPDRGTASPAPSIEELCPSTAAATIRSDAMTAPETPPADGAAFEAVAMNEVGIVRVSGLSRRSGETRTALSVRPDRDSVLVEIVSEGASRYTPPRSAMRLQAAEAAFVAKLLRDAAADGAPVTERLSRPSVSSYEQTSVWEIQSDGIVKTCRFESFDRPLSAGLEYGTMLTVRRTERGTVRLALDELPHGRAAPKIEMTPAHARHFANLVLDAAAAVNRKEG